MKKILLTGGRSPITLDLARSLNDCGFSVYGVESSPYTLCEYSNAFKKFKLITAPNDSLNQYKEELIAFINENKIDLVIPTNEEAFQISKIKEELSKVCHPLVSSLERLNQLHHKFEFNQQVVSLNLPAPKSYQTHTSEEILSLLDKIPSEKIVLKPSYSRFATQTLLLKKEAAKAYVFNHKEVFTIPYVLQEFIEGKELCSTSFALEGELLSHVTYSHDFTAGKGAGICFEAIHHPAIENWVRLFVKQTQFTGHLSFDFIINDKEELYPLECNPRATSGLHLLVHQKNYIENLTQTKLNLEIQKTPPSPEKKAQIKLAMLVYGFFSIRSISECFNWFKIFFTAREVIFSLNDIKPFFIQFVSFYSLIRKAKKANCSPLEYSTKDIEWNGSL